MFRWKHYVLEVYKERSFSKAAQNLFISQPSLSARIKKIEEELGTTLFDRSSSPLQLTESGRIYIEAAQEIAQIEQNVENHINSLNTLKTGHISIGASNLFAAYVLPSLIAHFKQKFPLIDIQVTEGNTAQLEELLSSNSLDCVIDNYQYDPSVYDKKLYCNEDILLAVPIHFSVNQEAKKYQLSREDILLKGEHFQNHPPVPLHLFSELPFIMLTPGNDTRIRGNNLCQSAGFHPNIILEFNQQTTAYMAASTQLGATFISDILVSQLPSFDNLVYYRLEGKSAKRQVYFYYKSHRHQTRAMEEFLAMIDN